MNTRCESLAAAVFRQTGVDSSRRTDRYRTRLDTDVHVHRYNIHERLFYFRLAVIQNADNMMAVNADGTMTCSPAAKL